MAFVMSALPFSLFLILFLLPISLSQSPTSSPSASSSSTLSTGFGFGSGNTEGGGGGGFAMNGGGGAGGGAGNGDSGFGGGAGVGAGASSLGLGCVDGACGGASVEGGPLQDASDVVSNGMGFGSGTTLTGGGGGFGTTGGGGSGGGGGNTEGGAGGGGGAGIGGTAAGSGQTDNIFGGGETQGSGAEGMQGGVATPQEVQQNGGIVNPGDTTDPMQTSGEPMTSAAGVPEESIETPGVPASSENTPVAPQIDESVTAENVSVEEVQDGSEVVTSTSGDAGVADGITAPPPPTATLPITETQPFTAVPPEAAEQGTQGYSYDSASTYPPVTTAVVSNEGTPQYSSYEEENNKYRNGEMDAGTAPSTTDAFETGIPPTTTETTEETTVSEGSEFSASPVIVGQDSSSEGDLGEPPLGLSAGDMDSAPSETFTTPTEPGAELLEPEPSTPPQASSEDIETIIPASTTTPTPVVTAIVPIAVRQSAGEALEVTADTNSTEMREVSIGVGEDLPEVKVVGSSEKCYVKSVRCCEVEVGCGYECHRRWERTCSKEEEEASCKWTDSLRCYPKICVEEKCEGSGEREDSRVVWNVAVVQRAA